MTKLLFLGSFLCCFKLLWGPDRTCWLAGSGLWVVHSCTTAWKLHYTYALQQRVIDNRTLNTFNNEICNLEFMNQEILISKLFAKSETTFRHIKCWISESGYLICLYNCQMQTGWSEYLHLLVFTIYCTLSL